MKPISVGLFPLLLTTLVTALVAGLMILPAGQTTARQIPEKPDWLESSNPLSGQKEAIEKGAELYFKFCVGCHGVKADGVSRFGDYAGNLTQYWRGFGEFIAIVSAGRPNKGMPPWGEYLNGTQMMQIGAYLETQAKKDAGVNWK